MDSLIPISGGTIALGAGAVGYGAYQGLQTRKAAYTAQADLQKIVRPAIEQLDEDAIKAGMALDQSLLDARVPLDKMLDHMLNSEIGGPIKLYKYVETTRKLGRVAKAEIDMQIEISRQIVKQTNASSHATVAATTIASEQALLGAQKAMRGPARHSAVGFYAGGILLAAGIGAGLVAARDAINS